MYEGSLCTILNIKNRKIQERLSPVIGKYPRIKITHRKKNKCVTFQKKKKTIKEETQEEEINTYTLSGAQNQC